MADVFDLLQAAQQQHELVAAQPDHGIRVAHALRQPFRHHYQQRIADMVAHAVVDEFELVQIDEGHRQNIVVAGGEIDGLLQPVGQHRAVGQPGQHVVGGLVFDLLLVIFAFRDIFDRTFVKQQPAVAVAHFAGVLGDPDDVAVFAVDLGFEVTHFAVGLHDAMYSPRFSGST